VQSTLSFCDVFRVFQCRSGGWSRERCHRVPRYPPVMAPLVMPAAARRQVIHSSPMSAPDQAKTTPPMSIPAARLRMGTKLRRVESLSVDDTATAPEGGNQMNSGVPVAECRHMDCVRRQIIPAVLCQSHGYARCCSCPTTVRFFSAQNAWVHLV